MYCHTSLYSLPTSHISGTLIGLDPLFWLPLKLRIGSLSALKPSPVVPGLWEIFNHPLQKVQILGLITGLFLFYTQCKCLVNGFYRYNNIIFYPTQIIKRIGLLMHRMNNTVMGPVFYIHLFSSHYFTMRCKA